MAEYPKQRTWPYLLGGLTIGTVLGLLFAAKPGREAREDVKDWLRKRREESREALARLRRPAREGWGENHRRKELVES